MPRIVLEKITKKWGSFVGVDELDLIIEDAGFVTLLGPSGCGKTTTLRMIAGLETPTSGKISIDDVVVFDSEKNINVPPAKRDVGFLFQNYALWPHMTVYENISFGLKNLKWSKEDIKTRVAELLAMLQIEQFSKRYPNELSGGQQQRVAIARTLAPKPKVLFMDEPLSNLDAKLRLEMRTELKKLHRETHSTFVYVTHDQLEAMTLATQVCLLKEGFLQQYQPPLTVYRKPANLFVADFVGNPTMNFLNSKIKRLSKSSVECEVSGNRMIFESTEDFVLPFEDQPKVKSTKPEDGTPESTPTSEPSNEVVIGIRPEHIIIADSGIPAIITTTLPSGMETIVKLDIGGTEITGVVFGIIDFEVDQKVFVRFGSNDIVLFDKDSENNISSGRIVLPNFKEKTTVTKKKATPAPKKTTVVKKTTKTKKTLSKKTA